MKRNNNAIQNTNHTYINNANALEHKK